MTKYKKMHTTGTGSGDQLSHLLTLTTLQSAVTYFGQQGTSYNTCDIRCVSYRNTTGWQYSSVFPQEYLNSFLLVLHVTTFSVHHPKWNERGLARLCKIITIHL